MGSGDEAGVMLAVALSERVAALASMTPKARTVPARELGLLAPATALVLQNVAMGQCLAGLRATQSGAPGDLMLQRHGRGGRSSSGGHPSRGGDLERLVW